MPHKDGSKSGGRRAGTPNKATAAVKAVAQKHTTAAIKVLHDIMKDEDQTAAARVAAAKELLDRGHGKAPQAVTGPYGDGPAEFVFRWAGEDEAEESALSHSAP